MAYLVDNVLGMRMEKVVKIILPSRNFLLSLQR